MVIVTGTANKRTKEKAQHPEAVIKDNMTLSKLVNERELITVDKGEKNFVFL